ncbi:hypothetical protein SERLADRAFT_410083 [Serpula lacrymans var. lacrymans S7.9]|uniref:Uncharacterized protein n=1 Tax=Serpula lacrymans var. lacrymans (strain S7.9) TaxID=578457 RepID=F8P3C2_SERL9|nr:uncharacterized protein SERLADRAFT_410083 [Serpula lacrymans var. lacrymans S7.9]EGO22653.1 hypothetical protein SERLADRAFT_410083 [Serpula lacrymans var. lacrymans S7.9]
MAINENISHTNNKVKRQCPLNRNLNNEFIRESVTSECESSVQFVEAPIWPMTSDPQSPGTILVPATPTPAPIWPMTSDSQSPGTILVPAMPRHERATLPRNDISHHSSPKIPSHPTTLIAVLTTPTAVPTTSTPAARLQNNISPVFTPSIHPRTTNIHESSSKAPIRPRIPGNQLTPPTLTSPPWTIDTWVTQLRLPEWLFSRQLEIPLFHVIVVGRNLSPEDVAKKLSFDGEGDHGNLILPLLTWLPGGHISANDSTAKQFDEDADITPTEMATRPDVDKVMEEAYKNIMLSPTGSAEDLTMLNQIKAQNWERRLYIPFQSALSVPPIQSSEDVERKYPPQTSHQKRLAPWLPCVGQPCRTTSADDDWEAIQMSEELLEKFQRSLAAVQVALSKKSVLAIQYPETLEIPWMLPCANCKANDDGRTPLTCVYNPKSKGSDTKKSLLALPLDDGMSPISHLEDMDMSSLSAEDLREVQMTCAQLTCPVAEHQMQLIEVRDVMDVKLS